MMTSSDDVSTAEMKNLVWRLNVRDDEVRQLKEEISRKDETIFVQQCRIKFLEDGIGTLQRPRTNRGIGISAEPTSAKKIQNDESAPDGSTKPCAEATALIKIAIERNAFLRHIDLKQREDLIKCMKLVNYKPGNVIMSEGEVGSTAYVIEDGSVEVLKHGVRVARLDSGNLFGEMAVLYNCMRTATIKAITACKLWSLSGHDYQVVITFNSRLQRRRRIEFLQSVRNIQKLPAETISQIADAVEEVHFSNNANIIQQGAVGDTFYMITSGQVRVTQSAASSNDEEDVLLTILTVGEYFGQNALETNEVRAANVIVDDVNGVDCLLLDNYFYQRLLKGKGLYQRVSIADRVPSTTESVLDSITLDDFDFITTLGVGGFGRVELVRLTSDRNKVYAMKRMRKYFIVNTRQQEHVKQERRLMLQMQSPFIVRLHRTFRDAKYVYLLMDLCPGGELWTVMKNVHKTLGRSLNDKESRFVIACVIEALTYLHTRGIVYRDLKPENLMLDDRGYVKMVDFGFAKRISHPGKKTWTFCGTPEYVAPEIILNKGHDYAADLWSLGILVYELLNGGPPFSSNDHMCTYNKILRGIYTVEFSKKIGKNPKNLIRKLCKDNPNDRLGYGSKGLDKLHKHKWFSGFDWDGLNHGRLTAPIMPKITSKTDTSNFDTNFTDDPVPPDELSGWDEDF